ncbi:hypothetical protein DFH11DRAFT_1722723 [Phellopilus nigrolimitatus]|nr:hypothetical protein DFH11DRAFT_1722723 [Phellopilus nigrolimitatus]
MSIETLLSLGIGVAFRFVVNTVCVQNDKAVGAIFGLWDGIFVHRAWRSDRLLEPATLLGLILCVCYDVLSHASAVKTFALVLGGALGVLLSDALPALWDELAGSFEGLSIRTVSIVEDFAHSDELSDFELSDVSLSFDDSSTTIETTEVWTAEQRTRKAIRKDQSIDTRSRRRSVVATSSSKRSYHESDSTQQVLETVAAPVPVLVPSPSPSLSRSVNIDVQAPSAPSWVSSPTIKSVPTIKPEEVISEVEVEVRPVGQRRSKLSARERKPWTPSTPAFPTHSTARQSLADIPDIPTPVEGLSPFLLFSTQPQRASHSRKARSGASIYAEERIVEAETTDSRAEMAQTVNKPEKSTLQDSRSLGFGYMESPSPRPVTPHNRSISPAPEIVIKNTSTATEITIPPAGASGLHIRLSPVDDQQLEEPTINVTSPNDGRSPGDASTPEPIIIMLPPSHGPHSEFDTTPPNDEQSDGRSAGDRSASPAQVFQVGEEFHTSAFEWRSTAWRDLSTPASPLAYETHAPEPWAFDFNSADLRMSSESLVEEIRPLDIDAREASQQAHYTSKWSPESSRQKHSRARSVASEHYREDSQFAQAGVQQSTWGSGPPAENRMPNPYSPTPGERYVEVEERYEGPSTVPLDQLQHLQHQGQSLVSSPTLEESILSGGPKASVFAKAQVLRQQAKDAEVRCKELQAERLEAQRQGHYARAFGLGFEIEDVEAETRRLHRKAERRFYLANNETPYADKIDVHHLKVLEAVRQTERALYAVQQRGGKELQVIVGRGKHSLGGVPVLKNAIIDKMTKFVRPFLTIIFITDWALLL